tara:strand:- start:1543 stop:1890 length:348 start_codon:yes stop_codon:yes gene_type:complete
MSKLKGLYEYTEREAQNLSIGQGGNTYCDGTEVKDLVNGAVVCAITVIEACKFSVLTAEKTLGSSQMYISVSDKGYENSGDTFAATDELPQGITIYGRWTNVNVSAGKIMCYIGS